MAELKCVGVLTLGRQVDLVIWAGLCVVHEFPHDDGEAVDVGFGRPAHLETGLSQELGGGPVHLYDKSPLVCYFYKCI